MVQVKKIAFIQKENESISHNEAIKEKENLGSILNHTVTINPTGEDPQGTLFQINFLFCLKRSVI